MSAGAASGHNDAKGVHSLLDSPQHDAGPTRRYAIPVFTAVERAQNRPSCVISEVIKTLHLFVVVAVLTVTSAMAQGPSVRPWLQQIASGWTTEAKKALPDLLIDHPTDPGVMFLHASLVDEPQRAMPMYERIVETYAASEWADDALLRVTLYAAYRRDTIKARRSLMTFRDQFSKSDLLPVAADAVRMSVGLPAAADRQPTVEKVAAKSVEAAAKPATKYVVQVGSFSSRVLAAKATAGYTAKRMLARVAEKKVSKTKTLYVIHVGDYATEAEASKDLGAVGAICKCKPIVVKL